MEIDKKMRELKRKYVFTLKTSVALLKDVSSSSLITTEALQIIKRAKEGKLDEITFTEIYKSQEDLIALLELRYLCYQ